MRLICTAMRLRPSFFASSVSRSVPSNFISLSVQVRPGGHLAFIPSIRRRAWTESKWRLKRHLDSVQARRRMLGIKAKCPPGRTWTEREIKLLGTLLDTELAKKLGRSLIAVQIKRITLKVPY